MHEGVVLHNCLNNLHENLPTMSVQRITMEKYEIKLRREDESKYLLTWIDEKGKL